MVGAPTLVPGRLTAARSYLGLSADWLAGVLDVTAADLADFDAGVRPPSAAELERLARVLRRPVAFFLEVEDRRFTTPEARRLAAHPQVRHLSLVDQAAVQEFAAFLRASGAPPKGSARRTSPSGDVIPRRTS